MYCILPDLLDGVGGKLGGVVDHHIVGRSDCALEYMQVLSRGTVPAH
jgi:hypothetical protein